MNARDMTVNRLKVALINLVIVAILGCLLRYYFFRPFPGFVYPYTLHAHSHLAFLGWVFMALYSFILYAFLPEEQVKARKYSLFFMLFQGANLGMLFTFPFTGYALWSIIFSTIHALGSMLFAVLFIREAGSKLKPEMQTSFAFVKWSLILMFISNFGPFALGPVMANGQGQSDLYYLLIYFYLHFQYNGWFTFAVIGLLLWYLQRKGIGTNTRLLRWVFRLKLIAVLPAYVLSALWLKPDGLWYWIGGMAGVIQLAGIILLIRFIWMNYRHILPGLTVIGRLMLVMALLAVVVQHALQFLSAIPELGAEAFGNRGVIIAYLHLVLIGFVTAFILFVMTAEDCFTAVIRCHTGLYLFIGAFLGTELILLFQPQVPQSTFWLLILAMLQLAGVILITTALRSTRRFTV